MMQAEQRKLYSEAEACVMLSVCEKVLRRAQRAAIVNATDKMSSHGGFPYLTVRHTGEPWPVGIAEFLTLKTDRLTPLALCAAALLARETNDA